MNKRNAIITELELLLTDLTMEVAHSADVINNLTKKFVIRESNFAENLEKLQGHLSALLQKQKPALANVVDAVTTTASPTHAAAERNATVKRKKHRRRKERTL